MPWTTLLPGALVLGWRRTPGRFQGNRLLLTWAVVIFCFFSASGSKLPSYILPIFPALALLIAQHIHRLPARRLVWHFGATALVSVLGIAGLIAMTRGWIGGRDNFSPQELDYRTWIIVGLLMLAAFSVLASILARQARPAAAAVALSFAGLIGTQIILQGHQTLSQQKSARRMVATFAPLLPVSAPVFSIGHYDQTLPFYLGRTITLVAWVDEFATGQRIEPQRSLPTEAAFIDRWRELPQAAAVMRPDTFERWRDEGLPMQLVYRDPARVVVLRNAVNTRP